MKLIKNIFLIFLASGLFALCNFFINPNVPRLGLLADEINLSMIDKLPKLFIIVDARSPKEFADGHIAGAINLSEESFDSQLGDFLDVWSPDSTILIYCNPTQCNSSRKVSDRLKSECNIKNIFVLKDDWRKWKN